MGLSYNVAGANLGFTYTSNYYAPMMKLKVSYDVGELATVGAGYQMSSEAKTQSQLGMDFKP